MYIQSNSSRPLIASLRIGGIVLAQAPVRRQIFRTIGFHLIEVLDLDRLNNQLSGIAVTC